MSWFKKEIKSQPVVDIPAKKQTLLQNEVQYTEYVLEVVTKQGQRYTVVFETEMITESDGTFYGGKTADIFLNAFLDSLNKQTFVLVNADYIRVEKIDSCRIEPRKVKHVHRWWGYETNA